MLRMASYRIHQSLVEKPLTIQAYWPMRSDEKVEQRVMTPEMWEQVKKAHNLT